LKHALGSTGSAFIVNQSFVPGENYIDGDGHGTFISGMLVGNGESSSGSIVGMVPGSRVWNVKVLDDTGEGDETWTENAIDWILAQPSKPDILSLSFGSTMPMPGIESKLKQLWKEGVAIVVASGNEGPEYFTVDSPGSALDLVTVGACTSDEYLLSFSSEGPTIGTYYYKPDLVAFGLEITSLSLSSGYCDGSGTSFSVPFVTAGIALLEQATGGVHSPDEIKAAILSSCHSIGYSYFMEGAGLPNFSAALELLNDPAWSGVFVMPSEIEMPVGKKEGSTANIDPYKIKPTVIASRTAGQIVVSIEGEAADAFTAKLEEYSGAGDGQFVISIAASTASPAFKSGTVVIRAKLLDGTTIATITVKISGSDPSIAPVIIIGIVVAALVGVIAFFAIAYRKGSRAMPYQQCEIDGTCTGP
jgi:hypothetical protein